MYRAIPSSNKLLQKKWSSKEQEIHLAKLREIKPSVDVNMPTQFRHIKKKLKKNQMQEGNFFIPKISHFIVFQIGTLRLKEKIVFYLRK